MAAGQTMRSMSRNRASIGRNSTIGWRRRSIRWRSSFSRTPFSARRRPPGRAARWRCLGMIGVVALLRLLGFLSVIVGVRVPGVLAAQYVALFGAIVAGSWQISRGRAIEPAAVVSKFATAITERLARATAS